MEPSNLALADRPQAAQFSVTELLLLRAWSEFHGLCMGIDLGRMIDGSACDEVVTLAERHAESVWTLWHAPEGTMVSSAHDETRCYADIADACAAIHPAVADQLTNIRPNSW